MKAKSALFVKWLEFLLRKWCTKTKKQSNWCTKTNEKLIKLLNFSEFWILMIYFKTDWNKIFNEKGSNKKLS